MSRLACALLALVAAAGVAAWPFEAKKGLPLNASKLPAYLTGNNTAAFKQGVAQAKEKLNATGLFNTSINLVSNMWGGDLPQRVRFVCNRGGGRRPGGRRLTTHGGERDWGTLRGWLSGCRRAVPSRQSVRVAASTSAANPASPLGCFPRAPSPCGFCWPRTAAGAALLVRSERGVWGRAWTGGGGGVEHRRAAEARAAV